MRIYSLIAVLAMLVFSAVVTPVAVRAGDNGNANGHCKDKAKGQANGHDDCAPPPPPPTLDCPMSEQQCVDFYPLGGNDLVECLNRVGSC